MILNAKRSSHWLDGACSLQPVYAKKYVKWKQKAKYAWTFDCVFFATDELCRNVDPGVLVMYTTVCLQARNFRLLYFGQTVSQPASRSCCTDTAVQILLYRSCRADPAVLISRADAAVPILPCRCCRADVAV